MLTPTTKIEAVNEMLTSIGVAPVNQLETAGFTDAAIAKQTLESVSREVQSRGYWFNRQWNVTLSPTSGSLIQVPPNLLQVKPANRTSYTNGETVNFIAREGKLFNLRTNSYTFSSSVRADTVMLLGFEDIPETARRYICIRAARIFQTKVLGDEGQFTYDSTHELEAWQSFAEEHITTGPSTIFLDRIAARRRGSLPMPAAGMGGSGGQQQ